ncbi:unnamed protein product [Paramecium sonneborni]|uniref:Uncharacterized protein n=1 Tax=Paramecium sonneborni TaxID=65129 RepID=A0A8S1MQL1_9CILI|nr:unnamed protein product [Paramecium sonneborni]
MGNACCHNQEIYQHQFQNNNSQIMTTILKQNDIWDSSQNDDDDDNISSIKQYITPSAASKVDLDFSQDTNQSKMKQTIQLQSTRKSVKISYNNFVTMKQGEWIEQYTILKNQDKEVMEVFGQDNIKKQVF